MAMNFEQARSNMVSQQVRTWDVLDSDVLDVLRELPREEFVPQKYRQLAYSDSMIPLDQGQAMLKPVVEGRLLQGLDLKPTDDVLEIGTGSGYFTACLASLCRRVTSVERYADLLKSAQGRLDDLDFSSVELIEADALSGWSATSRYDVIVLTGAVHALPDRMANWLKPGGRVCAIVGDSPNMHAMIATAQGKSLIRSQSMFETDIPYLIGGEPPVRFKF